jgi:cyclophilin family peptidyl-prolyl cis-trans isomerase
MKKSAFISAAVAVFVLSAGISKAEKPVPAPIPPEAPAAAAPSPAEIVDAAPASDWTAIAASDLLVMQLTPDAKVKPRLVVIQLMPAPFSQGWIGNIRKLAAAKFWDGTAIVRVQDNYVTQWGDPDGEDAAKAKKLPDGLAVVPESAYATTVKDELSSTWSDGGRDVVPHLIAPSIPLPNKPETKLSDPYAGRYAFVDGMAFRVLGAAKWEKEGKGMTGNTQITPYFYPTEVWPVHCYGMVGVGRNMSPNTGTGAELYTVIGHAPRHLDRNIALVGRIIEGMEHMSSLPRGTGALGFYEKPEERTQILSVRLMSDMPSDKSLPGYEYLNTESASFAKYVDARANRRDPFFITPAGGADICNIPVPVRRQKLR